MSDYLTDYISTSSIKVELSLSDYATKGDLKDLNVDTSDFALKTNLASLKAEIDKLDIPKLAAVPKDLSDLSVEVQKGFTKKTDFASLE